MPTIAIPLDIIRHIVENFCYDDIPTLQACARVSRSFLISSQKSLFYSIYLDGYHAEEGHCQRLQCVFADNPDLLSYVRELYVADYYPEDRVLGPTTWASRNESLHTIMMALPRLHLLSLKFSGDHYAQDWKLISVELKVALIDLCSRPSLNIFEIEGIENIPVDFLEPFHYLKELSASMSIPFKLSSSGQQDTLPGPLVRCNQARLEALEIRCSSDFQAVFQTIRASTDISQLREVSMRSESWGYMWESIKDLTSSLETLMWDDSSK
jgi:F-box domain